MTDLGSLTLNEFFAMAEKVGAAAKTIQEAQAMMGGAPMESRASSEDTGPHRITPPSLLDAGDAAVVARDKIDRARLLAQARLNAPSVEP